MTRYETAREGVHDLEGLSLDMQQAITQARTATRDLAHLEDLVALPGAMAGLAQMGAVIGKMRAASQRVEESVENPEEDSDPHPLQHLSPLPSLVYLK